jgi:hypothetical protein
MELLALLFTEEELVPGTEEAELSEESCDEARLEELETEAAWLELLPPRLAEELPPPPPQAVKASNTEIIKNGKCARHTRCEQAEACL